MLKLFYGVAAFFSFVNGAWMLLLPLSWYTDFPAAVHHTGAFNPHFVRDIGVAYVVSALGFAWCALRPAAESRPVHAGLALFFAGHALLHLADILSGRLPQVHWLIDTPLVFVPALILIVLSFRSVRRRLGERG